MNSVVPRNALSPRVMLAAAMQAQPGVYALLLGSGISTGAGIPTGWGVVTNLVKKAAIAADPKDTASHDLAEKDPEAWWAEHGSGELGYSSLLAAIAPTPAARQGILREYFVATEADIDADNKVPCAAHHAVAKLVKRGTVKVILTTNFDRLIEQALEAAGIQPQVITRPEAVAGMTPLPHADATVIKLHGDYAALDSLNTLDELTDYPVQWTDLLARVFAEYGLLISGWSGEWDKALAAALQAAPRRYPLYWDSRSSKSTAAQQLLKSQHGHVLTAGSADELFTDSVEALDRLAEPPLTTAMAIARLKRCLPDPVRRIELHDLVMGKVEETVHAISQLRVDGDATPDAIDERLARLLAETTPLLHLLIEGVHHDIDGTHTQLWVDVLQRLLDGYRTFTGYPILISLQHYPALLALRTMSIVAVHRGRDDLLIELLTKPKWTNPANQYGPKSAAHVLHMQLVLERSVINSLPRWNGGGWQQPQSHLLSADLQEIFDRYLTGQDRYVTVSHDVEYRTGLVQHLYPEQGGLQPNSGEFVGDYRWTHDNQPHAEIRLREQIATAGPRHWTSLIQDGVWDDKYLASYREILTQYRRFG